MLRLLEDEHWAEWSDSDIARRNLTNYQRAELVLKLEPLISPGQGARTELRQNSDKVDTKRELAHVAGVSHDTVAKAKVIDREADEQTKARLRMVSQSPTTSQASNAFSVSPKSFIFFLSYSPGSPGWPRAHDRRGPFRRFYHNGDQQTLFWLRQGRIRA